PRTSRPARWSRTRKRPAANRRMAWWSPTSCRRPTRGGTTMSRPAHCPWRRSPAGPYRSGARNETDAASRREGPDELRLAVACLAGDHDTAGAGGHAFGGGRDRLAFRRPGAEHRDRLRRDVDRRRAAAAAADAAVAVRVCARG